SLVFLPRLISVVVWEAIKKEGPQLLKTTTAFADDQAWFKLGDTVKDGAGKAQAKAADWWRKARDAVATPQDATEVDSKKTDIKPVDAKNAAPQP
ncbi:MAG: hypothetical protein ACREP7_17855, partial [Lysobacter sp.]